MALISIEEERYSKEIEEKVLKGFAEHALDSMSSDGDIKRFTFVARDEGLKGALIAKTFWGSFHIKHLYLDADCRGQGIGKQLMKQALEKAKALGCRFAFVETLSFQALDFYKSLGFSEEFVRHGYDKGVSFHYMKKAL